jgi:hypothetical protein
MVVLPPKLWREQSVRSIVGETEVSELYSDKQLLKSVVWKLSISGPAGYQYSAQAGNELIVGHGCGTAWASGIPGNVRPLDRGPARPARERATKSARKGFEKYFMVKYFLSLPLYKRVHG